MGGTVSGDEPVGVVCNARQSIVPGKEGRKETEIASSLDATLVGLSARVLEVSNAEKEEGNVEREEE